MNEMKVKGLEQGEHSTPYYIAHCTAHSTQRTAVYSSAEGRGLKRKFNLTHPKTAAFTLVERECRLSIASSTMKEFKRSVTYDREVNGEDNYHG